MAERRWQSNSSDYNDVLNWGGTVPQNGDDITIPASATIGPQIGLDQSSVSPSLFHVEEGCTVDIGAPGNPLIYNTISDTEHSGAGAFYLNMVSGGSGGALYCVCDADDGLLYVTGDPPDYVFAVSGELHMAATAGTCDRLVVCPASGKQLPLVIVDSAVTDAYVFGGTVEVRQGSIVIVQAISGASLIVSPAGSVTSVYSDTGAVLDWNGSGPAFLVAMGGVCDWTGSAALRTVTDARRFAGATLTYDSSLVTFTSLMDVPVIMGLPAS